MIRVIEVKSNSATSKLTFFMMFKTAHNPIKAKGKSIYGLCDSPSGSIDIKGKIKQWTRHNPALLIPKISIFNDVVFFISLYICLMQFSCKYRNIFVIATMLRLNFIRL